MGNCVHFAQAQQSTTFKGKLVTGIELRYNRHDRNRSRKDQHMEGFKPLTTSL